MHILRSYTACPRDLQHSVVALGNFDGVHQGHQAVIRAACKIARALNKPAAALTFEPHPVAVLRPPLEPFRIEDFRAKANHIQALGVDALFVLGFTKRFAQISAGDFVKDILANGLHASHVVIGRDFIFGHNRAGNAALLQSLTEHYGIGFTQVQPVTIGGEGCASSTIRQYIKNGQIAKAAALLGRFPAVEGRVRHGDRRGQQLGYPTANLSLKRVLHPAYGVYAAYVTVEGKRYPAVVNIGRRPTFNQTEIVAEAHILDISMELYGKRIKVELADYLRAEQKFAGSAALQAQIGKDILQARELLS